MKNNCKLTIRLSEDMMRKFLYVCQTENRTPANQFNFMLRNNISYFEKTKGRIPDAKLREIDLSEYIEEE